MMHARTCTQYLSMVLWYLEPCGANSKGLIKVLASSVIHSIFAGVHVWQATAL